MGKKLLLEYEDESPYFYLGISSSLQDYQLIFHLNRQLNLKFKHVEPFHFLKKDQDFVYSLYLYIDHENMVNYYLISNSANAARLVPHYKQLDFFIIMEGEIDENYVDEQAKRIRQLPEVLYTTQLESEGFDKIKNLRYEFDLHLEQVLKVI